MEVFWLPAYSGCLPSYHYTALHILLFSLSSLAIQPASFAPFLLFVMVHCCKLNVKFELSFQFVCMNSMGL